jgi:hypothetical protein
VAIEPHEGMRAELVKRLGESVKVLDDDAANMSVEEGWGDALVVAYVSFGGVQWPV